MTSKPKKRLCWNCEGSASFKDEICPYCGVYLSPINLPNGLSDGNHSNSLLNPPYQIEKDQDQEIPEAPYGDASTSPSNASSSDSPEVETLNIDFKELALMTVLLLGGVLFLLFGLALFLFSQNGVFTLKWNGDFWFIYLALSLPMLYFGWRLLQQQSD